jgi:two-component system, chemotaxis family, sensor kinase CheA
MIEQVLAQIDNLTARVAAKASVPEMLKALADIEKLSREAGRKPAGDFANDLAQRTLRADGDKLERIVRVGLELLRDVLNEPPHAEEESGEEMPEEDSLEPQVVSTTAPVPQEQVAQQQASSQPALPQQQAQQTPAPAAMPSSIAQDPELIGDFINEASEHLATIESEVLTLERDPSANAPLHAAFRSFHTIKGLAGFLELNDIRSVSHDVETLLDRARNRQLAVTPAVTDVVLEGADYLKRAVAWVEASLRGTPTAPPETATVLSHVRLALEGKLDTLPVRAAIAETASGPAGEAPQKSGTEKASAEKTTEAGFSLRVDAGKLDSMMDMVGELVIAQSMLMHSPELAQLAGSNLQRNLQELARITVDVQRMAMSLRMTPVSQLYSKMTRLVRDLSRKTGKTVRLELCGEDTELDKTIVEQLADPLMHMVRNSLDHGLETPDERVAKGKPAEGLLRLAASHQAGQIVVEVTDDGRGLNTEKILRKAREKGIVAEGQNPSENEIFHLIFAPGFSTADKITDVSGRGVGMDVVRKQIQGLRGRIEIRSEKDAGSTFLLKLPLTLAIIEGLIVTIGEGRYILPISNVREMLRPTADMLFTIENRAEMAMIRGELVPILRLDRRFGIPGAVQNPPDGLFVIVESEGRSYCLLVDSMIGKQEVVIKSLGETFQNVAGISGGAILGDGRVGLILDVAGVLRGSPRA